MSAADRTPNAASSSTSAPAQRDTRRLPLALILAGAIVAAGVWRRAVADRFQPVDDTLGRAGRGASVEQFDSYTLGLLLGGLRGPLVMTLWSSSEAQKGERNLEDINTKIELIRLLQPEFDAVHMFQIWNKAYNLSVQMSNLASKYATILDALDYADDARAGKANVNIEAAVAGIYFDKLGNSNEKAFYRARVREDTRVPEGQAKLVFPATRRDEFVRAALAAGADARRYTLRPESGADDRLSVRLRDEYAESILKTFALDASAITRSPPRVNASGATSMRAALDPVLDANGRLVAGVYDRSRPTDVADLDWRPQDGELASLGRFEPYPYGVSPFALAYNYYKRAVALQEGQKQVHAQLSERVISSRPAQSLKAWAEEEIELGRLAEMAQFGLAPLDYDASVLPMEAPAAGLPLTATPSMPLLREAIYSYERAADLGDLSVAEFRRHTERYKDDLALYTSQLADVASRGELSRGDALFLRIITTTDDAARRAAAAEAATHYAKAIETLERTILAFYIPDPTIAATFPQGYGKLDVINSFANPAAFPAEQVRPTLQRAFAAMAQANEEPGSEVTEYQTYSARAQTRLATLAPLLK